MPRFSLATALLTVIPSAVKAADGHEGNDADAWAFLPATMPSPLSDMSVSHLTVGGGGVDGEAIDVDAKKRIIITGGCDDPEGNKLGEDGYFSCPSLSNKVCMCLQTYYWIAFYIKMKNIAYLEGGVMGQFNNR